MEASMAVDVVLKNNLLLKHNCRVKVLIGDDDSSSIAALRRLSPYSIVKWSDFNHAHKTWNSKLYEMKVPASLREYFSKVFSLCIKKNIGDEEKVKSALCNVIPHAFGDHTNCGDYCTVDENGKHHYKYFKNGECLTDASLKQKLQTALQPFINNAAQLAPCASSQANESFNNTVCSKHPKYVFYGGSESHVIRVQLAVCQKNVGYIFIVKLFKKLNLSPGKNTEKFRNKKDSLLKSRLAVKKTTAFKKRRADLKKNRASKNSSATTKEGISYQSGSGYLNTSELIDECIIPGKI